MIVRVEKDRVSWPGPPSPDGFGAAGGQARCAIGRSGLIPAADKREGDGATPAGRYPFRRVLYRADRGPRPETELTVIALRADDGWCDDPADAESYNRPVTLPHAGSHEEMWREDGLYDIVVVIGHNDSPPVPGMGSAIFVHCANIDAAGAYATTAGCVALAKDDLRALLASVTPGDEIEIVL